MTFFDPSPFAPSDNPLSDDPWTRILLPATLGQEEIAMEAMIDLESRLPEGDHGLLLAVSARALAALGHRSAAHEVCQRALTLGGAEAAALATVLTDEGLSWATARLAVGTAGERADAGCDLALLLLRDGDRVGAARAVSEALAACPRHCEAGRWRRFLDDAGLDAADRLADADTPFPVDDSPPANDAVELSPQAWFGLLSPERLVRRLGSGLWCSPAAPGSALDHLQQVGCVTRMVAMDCDYADVAPDHPLVAIELAVDLTAALYSERRPSVVAALEAWSLARAHDAIATEDVANFLVPHAISDASCTSLGLDAVAHLSAEQPGKRLWPAYRARLLAQSGATEEATDLARDLLSERGLEPMEAWQALDALRSAGRASDAVARARSMRRHPVLGAVMRALLATWEDGKEHRPAATGRLRPRFGQSA